MKFLTESRENFFQNFFQVDRDTFFNVTNVMKNFAIALKKSPFAPLNPRSRGFCYGGLKNPKLFRC